jgi:hypothetical protein
MEKVVHLFKPFNSIFYLKKIEHEKSTFNQINSKPFENFGTITKGHCVFGLGP